MSKSKKNLPKGVKRGRRRSIPDALAKLEICGHEPPQDQSATDYHLLPEPEMKNLNDVYINVNVFPNHHLDVLWVGDDYDEGDDDYLSWW